ncbi:MAG TPA: CHAT domain-containing tetratricopeptide repeat protein [Fimbriiglobus sp.]|nr:CHAT domain-containing tetratricopeptide repeat protein [Fimbriiglobus sp.]
MRLFALPSALAVGALTLPLHGLPAHGQEKKPVEAPRPPARPDPVVEHARQFAASLDSWGAVCGGGAGLAGGQQLYAKYFGLWKAGRFAEARDLIRAVLAVSTRTYGEDHFETRNFRTLLSSLEHVAALPDADRAEYVETIKLGAEVVTLSQQGKYPEAIRLSQKLLDIRRRLLRPDDLAVYVNHHATLLYDATRYAEAESYFREALDLCRRIVGPDHPATAAVRGNLAMTLSKLDRFDEARPLYDEAVAIKRRLFGEDHPDTALAYSNLATHLDDQGKHAEAEPILRRVLDTFCRSEGKDGRHALIARNNLAFNFAAQGRYEEAERLYREVIDILLRPAGDEYAAAATSALALTAQHLWRQNHPEAAHAYSNLAVTLGDQGRYADAEPLYRQSLAIFRAFDEQSAFTASTSSSLAVTLHSQGKYEEAEQLYEKAVQIYLRANKGKKSRELAKVYNNRAANLVSQEKFAEAQQVHEEALAILRELFGKDHPEVAASCNNLASTLSKLEKHAEAEPLFREALEIQERLLGADHPYTTAARINLAVNLHQQGKLAEAGTMLEAGLGRNRRVLGEGHPSTANAYKHLVINAWARGEYARVEELGPAAAASFEAARRRVSFVGLGRVSNSDVLSPLRHLSAVAARNGRLAAAWGYLETNLARGLLDDLAPRALSAEERAAEQGLLLQLDRLDKRLGTLPDGPEVTAAARKKVEEVRRERDVAQAKLVQLQAELAARHGVAAGKVYDLSRIQERLRPDEALLAWVDIPAEAKAPDPNGEHWACVVRNRGKPAWVRLTGRGPGGAWTDDDGRLAARVRRSFAARPADPRAGWKDLAGELARQRLTPLEKPLEGVRHLVVLPSAKLAGVPVEALTDRFTVSYAPSGTTFAWLREKQREAGREPPPPSLLGLGDPVFKPARGGTDRGETFDRLEGTVKELSGIARVFPKVELFKGSEASERNLDLLAADGRLGQFRYLHFATHGVVDDIRPLRSALILARDTLPDPLEQVLGGKETYDGRLTAERILRRWKLDADLVTLSACRTGLGRYSGGEGYVGFSQALFLAGARSLVLSLWEVDDAATALLMTRFYENLIGTPEETVRPMPKAEALAEAKRWLRGLNSDEVQQLTKDLTTRGTRGKIVKKAAAAKAAPSYEHPYYWSGFVLVGDPR